ncbi:DUF3667 domain-containing protein [Spirosoma sp. RP8]|uniref:DUF3667 domain-containing protein n=1 Tax=Spirosoma liriopis TaxID=2937440 RepID=A0ABT0HJY6_9BACT|nr:DUF3667 domain-containing protein [Spirosoma liriopis]MCK8492482.1 DUF3667 domain-containing protein [Spirosoma liriopis]
MSNHHNKLSVCPNCGQNLSPHDNFCPNCGQENHEVKLPLGHIIYEFVESITHFDNKLWNSLKAIFTRPGKMTAEFLEGKRARYVPPARLYVFVSVIFFFLIGKFADHQLEEGINSLKNVSGTDTTDASSVIRVDIEDLISNDSLLRSRGLHRMARKIDVNTSLTREGLARTARRIKRLQPAQLDSTLKEANLTVVDSNQTKLRELIALVPQQPTLSLSFSNMMGKEFKTKEERENYEAKLGQMSSVQIDSLIRAEGSTPNWFTRKLYGQQGKFSHLMKGENTHELLHAIMKNFSVVMFILMPFVAILLLLFYFRRGRFYYEHLIFSVHIHTVLFLLFSIALATTFFANPKLSSSVLLWTFWISWLYFLLSIKRVYGQSWGKTILKFFLLSMMYGLTAMFFLLGALGVGFLTF